MATLILSEMTHRSVTIATMAVQTGVLSIFAESESELFTGDTSKDNHSPGPVFREVSP